MRKSICFVVCCLATLIPATAAIAGLGTAPYVYGFGARGIAMGAAFSALPDDSSSAFFNPAAMASLKQSHLSMGYIWGQPEFEGGPKGDTFTFDDSNRIMQINWVAKLNSMFKNNHDVALGVNLSLDDNLTAFIRFYDPEVAEGYYPMYGPYGFTLNATLGFGLLEWLYLGGGVMTTLHGDTDFALHTDLGGNTSHESTSLNADVVFAPLLALFLRFGIVDIGLSYHGRIYGQFVPINVSASADVGENELADLPMKVYFKDVYHPHRIGLGMFWHAADWVGIALDAVWYNWGDFDDEISIDDDPRAEAGHDFTDIIVPHLGLEFMAFTNFFLRTGYSYESSPINKAGTTMQVMLSNDKHIGSFGLGYTWENPPLLQQPISLDGAYAFHYLVPEDLTSNEGYEYESSGYLNMLTATLTLRY